MGNKLNILTAAEELNREQTAGSRVAVLSALIKNNTFPDFSREVNNHVHTTYSFSPYCPAAAALGARMAGLRAVGVMDHDSLGGADEMVRACQVLGIASTVGCEIRVNADGTVLEGRKINNPDSQNILYMAIHGVPKSRWKECQTFLEPIRQRRLERNKAQVEALNTILADTEISPVDFDTEVLPQQESGGGMTERHILYALAEKIEERWGRGESLITRLYSEFGIIVPGTITERLSDPGNPHFLYDLLGVMKSQLLPRFFIQPDKQECINVRDAVSFANKINAIPAYAYLGDVGESPTGDKKAEKFEDDFLDLLIPGLKDIGFKAVTYMPPRNTKAQLRRLKDLCAENGLMEISGVDINSSRQQFNCPELLYPDFDHLITAAWALIAHEKLTSADERLSLFHPANPKAGESLEKRIALYSEIGKSLNRDDMNTSAEVIANTMKHQGGVV